LLAAFLCNQPRAKVSVSIAVIDPEYLSASQRVGTPVPQPISRIADQRFGTAENAFSRYFNNPLLQLSLL
jgi:hypothetical protein